MVILDRTTTSLLPENGGGGSSSSSSSGSNASVSSHPLNSPTSTSATGTTTSAAVVAASAAAAASLAASISAANQYLNPDYVSPLADADSKTSPLAMLAKTCSQIGADTNGISRNNNNGSEVTLNALNALRNAVGGGGRSSSGAKSVSPDKLLLEGGRSRSSSVEIKVADPIIPKAPSSTSSSSLSPASSAAAAEDKHHTTTTIPSPKRSSLSKTPNRTTLPQPPATTTNSSSSNNNNNPFLAFSSNPFLAAAAGLVTPPPATTASSSSAGSPCRDPLCRDPLCPTSIRNAQLLAAASGSVFPGSNPTTATASASSLLIAQQREAMRAMTSAAASGGSYICNWVSGASDYCGRRFSTSEELLLHLKTHTNLSVPSLSPSLHSSSSSRFHPYSRPHMPIPAAAAAAPSIPGLIPPGAYLNPYAALYPALFPRPSML